MGAHDDDWKAKTTGGNEIQGDDQLDNTVLTMRVLHFCDQFSLLTQTFVYDQLRALEARGLDCHVLCLGRQNEDTRPFPNVHLLAQVASPPPKGHPRRLLGKLRSLTHKRHRDDPYRWYMKQSSIGRFLQELRPDVVHAHFGQAGALIAPAAARKGVPLLVSFYGLDASSLPQQAEWARKYAELFHHADGISTVSHVMAARLAGLNAPRSRLRVVRLGKRMSEYPFRAPERQVQDWISVGRMTEKKGHMDCIMAFDRLAEQAPTARLQIVGGGELLEDTRRVAENAKHGDRITLLGPLPHEETARLMRAADAFVLCSKTAANGDEEGTPTVLLEAQALGKPCVTTRHAGIPESIPLEGQWLIAEEGDVAGIAERMQALAQCSVDQLTEIACAGRTKVEKEFDIDSEAARLEAWYTELASATAVASGSA